MGRYIGGYMEIKNFRMSKHFWFNEMVSTSHIELQHQNLIESVEFIYNATVFARDILDECREFLGLMTPESWFRGPELNKKVRGALNSSHMRGQAIDYTRWNTWPMVDMWGRDLAKHLLSKGKKFKIIIESREDSYWLHIGAAQEPSLWTGINGIYVRQEIS